MKLSSTESIKNLEISLKKLDRLYSSFDYLKITIASPERIREWSERILPNGESIGEVISPETINFRSQDTEPGGLFCQRIFGPTKDWRCQCKRYVGFASDRVNKICEYCGVELIEARVRRYRMGYINLTCPIGHYWYIKGVPNYILMLLKDKFIELKLTHIEQIIYFRAGESIIDDMNPLGIYYTEKTELEKLSVKGFLERKFQSIKSHLALKKAEKTTGKEMEDEEEEDSPDLNIEKIKEDKKKKKKKVSKKETSNSKIGSIPITPLTKLAKEEINVDLAAIYPEIASEIEETIELRKKEQEEEQEEQEEQEEEDENENFLTEKMKKNKEEFKIYGEIMNQSGYIPLIKMMDEVIYYLPTILGSSERRLIGHPRKGGEIIQAALEELDLNELIKTGREEIIRIRTIGRAQIIAKATLRRIRISESFLSTGTKPEWMMLTVLPVLPPSLRPFVELGNGKLVAADLNELYRLIITRNQRLFDFIYVSNLPNLISIYARKLLQESVDSLIDNGKLPKNKIIYLNNNPLKSLTEVLEGKQGRFRHSLLGKRVDYSGRSVIIVNPLLRLNQCGLPYDMAKELFQPFLVNELIRHIMKVHNTKLAQVIIKRNKPAVWRILKKLSRSRSVLLNRAPTLHRFGIQAFDPIIVLEQSIHLHPLVCTGFNADFDGDQMAIHMPLYESSQLEAKYMMRPSYNILTPTNGDVILKPTQDMVIGCYYLTFMISNHPNLFKRCFSNESEVLRAFYQKKIDLHTPIFLKYSVSEFKLKIEKNELFLKLKDNYHLNYQKVIIYKKFQNKEKNYYFITNLGIFIAKNFLNQFVELTTLLFETTTGRLIFNKNVKEALQGTIENKDYIDKAYTEVEISQNINTENS